MLQRLWNIPSVPVVLLKWWAVSSSSHLHPSLDRRFSMKHTIALGLLISAALAAAPVAPQAEKSQVAKMTLKVGDTAPEFPLLSNQLKTVKLSAYPGKNNLFLDV